MIFPGDDFDFFAVGVFEYFFHVDHILVRVIFGGF